MNVKRGSNGQPFPKKRLFELSSINKYKLPLEPRAIHTLHQSKDEEKTATEKKSLKTGSNHKKTVSTKTEKQALNDAFG